MSDSNHTVRIIQDNRGIKFLVGAVALFLLIRWWLTGSILHVFEAVQEVDADTDVASAGNAIVDSIVPIVLDIVIAFGGVLLTTSLGLWQVVWNLIRAAITYFHTSQLASAIGTRAAVQVAGQSIGTAIGQEAVAQPVAPPVIPQSRAINPEKLAKWVHQADDRLKALELKVFPPPEPAPLVVSQAESIASTDSRSPSEDRLAVLESQLAALVQVVNKTQPAKRATKAVAK